YSRAEPALRSGRSGRDSGHDGQLVQIIDERPHRAVPPSHAGVRRLDHEVLVGSVGAAAVAEAEVGRGKVERLDGDDVPRTGAGVARQQYGDETGATIDRHLGA